MCHYAAIVLGAAVATSAVSGAEPPAPFGACPTPAQVAWHDLEFYGFFHFTTNTFTDREWGDGAESESVFSPTALDCGQWAAVAKDCGMKGMILTAKHHDGFCLWPSALTEHSVKKSPWKGGRGDVVGEFAAATRAQGLKVGLYLSPWDRNHAEYARAAYIEYYRAQLKELIGSYGPLFEVWFDGANGGDGYYGGAKEKRKIDGSTYYGWADTNRLVLSLNPDAIIFSDAGPGCRWVGNEQGYSDEESWQTLNLDGLYPGVPHNHLAFGDKGGSHWVGVEVDVSIRPGWFWHESENFKVKTPQQLVDIWYKSVGRGANLLLNVPPDRRGVIHENDAASLREFGRIVRETFKTNLAKGSKPSASNVRAGNATFAAAMALDGDGKTYWATDDGVTSGELVAEFGAPTTFDVVRVSEFIPLGQRVEKFSVEYFDGKDWKELCKGSTIGPRRAIRTPLVTAAKVRLKIERALACPTIAEFGVYRQAQPGK